MSKILLETLTVLIIDPDKGMHMMGRLLLRSMTFGETIIKIISANSPEEARQAFAVNSNIAALVISAPKNQLMPYIEFIRYIRNTLKRSEPKIILRIASYEDFRNIDDHETLEINDLRKTDELTEENFSVVIRTALRAYVADTSLQNHFKGLNSLITELSGAEVNAKQTLPDVLNKVEVLLGIPEARNKLVLDPYTNWKEIYSSGKFSGFTKNEAFESNKELISKIKEKIRPETSFFFLLDDKLIFSLNMIANKRYLCCILGCPENYRDSYSLKISELFIHEYELKIRNQRLQQDLLMSHRHVLTKLCESVEVRSPETGKHIYRIGKYAALFAKILGLDENFQTLIEHAAPLHDIGKIAIADTILMKPGKLTEDEFEIMKSHVIHGFNFLRNQDGTSSPLLDLAAEIALTHHEKWDGSGYPNKTKGMDIPISGRIVVLCDVFDALRSKRCYKESFPIKETLRIILKDAGTHFDPKLTKIFTEHSAKFDQVFLDNSDADNVNHEATLSRQYLAEYSKLTP